MNRVFVGLVIAVGFAAASAAATGVVRIVEKPNVESVTAHSAIITWTTNTAWRANAIQYGVVSYGTEPADLNLTARSPNRWNKSLPEMRYRVRIDGLKPGTTYHYTVDAALGNGSRARLESPVRQFTTPGP